jgi:hypothetical protein
MNGEFVEEYFVGSKDPKELNPLNETDREIFVEEIQTFDTDCKSILLFGFFKENSHVVTGMVTWFLDNRDRGWDLGGN